MKAMNKYDCALVEEGDLFVSLDDLGRAYIILEIMSINSALMLIFLRGKITTNIYEVAFDEYYAHIKLHENDI